MQYTAAFRRLRTSNPDPDQKDQHSSDNHLKSGTEKRRVHISLSNPADEQEFNRHDHNSNGRSGPKIRNQKRQRVTDSSCRGHQPADKPTKQRFATAGQTAVIRNALSESHGNSRSNASGEAHQEGGMTVLGCKGCRKNRRKG